MEKQVENKTENPLMGEIHDIAFVNFVENREKPDESMGMKELGEHIAQGFKPFSVTSYMGAPKHNLLGKAATPILVERIWLTRMRLVPISAAKPAGEAAEALPEMPK